MTSPIFLAPRAKRPGVSDSTIVLLVVAVIVGLVFIGGWALMVFVALLGGSISYLHAIGAFLLLRVFLLPAQIKKES